LRKRRDPILLAISIEKGLIENFHQLNTKKERGVGILNEIKRGRGFFKGFETPGIVSLEIRSVRI